MGIQGCAQCQDKSNPVYEYRRRWMAVIDSNLIQELSHNDLNGIVTITVFDIHILFK